MDPQDSEATAIKPSEIHENAALAEAKTGEEIAGRSAPADRIHADVGQWSAQGCAEGPEVDATLRDFIEVVLGGKSFSALYDPGAQVSFVGPKIAIYYEKRLFKKKDMLKGAVCKGVTQTLGLLGMNMEINGHSQTVIMEAVPDTSYDMVLGMDFMKAWMSNSENGDGRWRVLKGGYKYFVGSQKEKSDGRIFAECAGLVVVKEDERTELEKMVKKMVEDADGDVGLTDLAKHFIKVFDETPKMTVADVYEDNLSTGRPDFGELYPHPVDALEQETLWQEREDTRRLERQRRTGEESRALQAVNLVRGSSEVVSRGANEEMLAPPPEFADKATTSNSRPVEKEWKGAPSRIALPNIPKRRDLGTDGHGATVPPIEGLDSGQSQREGESLVGKGERPMAQVKPTNWSLQPVPIDGIIPIDRMPKERAEWGREPSVRGTYTPRDRPSRREVPEPEGVWPRYQVDTDGVARPEIRDESPPPRPGNVSRRVAEGYPCHFGFPSEVSIRKLTRRQDEIDLGGEDAPLS
ncbi:hypothetical protein QAD02_007938 [Eretmocerus hayati]|uniref:Uncharacterized protein n=1 Tax=Eretmocerus hayati TaxID=131215 RepID=A0ACC2N5B7_9HYME|nr:hypothetical protein QAD02_007938 [Eretmocerus hayati]